eukprot:m.24910 g.24910  ORF g.24910 m.24910 type:complete len:1234 (+) comp7656_c0_seq2:108-3809(+)
MEGDDNGEKTLTNVFLLGATQNIQWTRHILRVVPGSHPKVSYPVFQLFTKILDEGTACVWFPSTDKPLFECLRFSFNKAPEDLILPQGLQTEKVSNGQLQDADLRTRFLQAIMCLIERNLWKQNFVRIGNLFIKQSSQKDLMPLALSFSLYESEGNLFLRAYVTRHLFYKLQLTDRINAVHVVLAPLFVRATLLASQPLFKLDDTEYAHWESCFPSGTESDEKGIVVMYNNERIVYPSRLVFGLHGLSNVTNANALETSASDENIDTQNLFHQLYWQRFIGSNIGSPLSPPPIMDIRTKRRGSIQTIDHNSGNKKRLVGTNKKASPQELSVSQEDENPNSMNSTPSGLVIKDSDSGASPTITQPNIEEEIPDIVAIWRNSQSSSIGITKLRQMRKSRPWPRGRVHMHPKSYRRIETEFEKLPEELRYRPHTPETPETSTPTTVIGEHLSKSAALNTVSPFNARRFSLSRSVSPSVRTTYEMMQQERSKPKLDESFLNMSKTDLLYKSMMEAITNSCSFEQNANKTTESNIMETTQLHESNMEMLVQAHPFTATLQDIDQQRKGNSNSHDTFYEQSEEKATVRHVRYLRQPSTDAVVHALSTVSDTIKTVSWRTDEKGDSPLVLSSCIQKEEYIIDDLAIPAVIVGHDEHWLSLSPQSVSHWDTLSLKPYGRKRDVSFYAVTPSDAILKRSFTSFIDEVGCVYTTCNLGKHVAPQTADNQFTVDFSLIGKTMADATDLTAFKQEYEKVFSNLATSITVADKARHTSLQATMGESPSEASQQSGVPPATPTQKERRLSVGMNGNTTSRNNIAGNSSSSSSGGSSNSGSIDERSEDPLQVVYVINPFGNQDVSAYADLHAWFNSAMRKVPDSVRRNLLLQVIHVDDILTMGSIKLERNKSQCTRDVFKATAFSIFLRGTDSTAEVNSVLSMSLGKDDCGQQRCYRPLFVLAPRVVEPILFTHEGIKLGRQLPSRVLHVAFDRDPSRHYVCVVWMDACGTQLETAVFQNSPDSDVFEKILQGTEHLADCESVRWRIIMCKTSDVTDSEVQAWRDVVATRINQLTGNLAPGIICSALVSLQEESEFQVLFPHDVAGGKQKKHPLLPKSRCLIPWPATNGPDEWSHSSPHRNNQVHALLYTTWPAHIAWSSATEVSVPPINQQESQSLRITYHTHMTETKPNASLATHPLDSCPKSVIRFIAEQYHDLSWLTMNPASLCGQKSKLPLHVLVLWSLRNTL